ncbi:C-reactive protein [Trichechus manatus latirostris]|uniref:C-reactive protein n=1 Tax=Trichechus manatus latirostris TaxID=127582 RepID=A0A2Y9QP27_TRIMA|nr:C-reactive protein [Trichechus manatus latirostris]
MEKLWWCFLVLTSLSNVSGQTDMHKKAFVFPKESASSYVSLKAQLKKPLRAFTICLHVYSELNPTHGTFNPNILDWRELKYDIHGEVFIKPQLWS